jgi:hypothetical protein
MNEPEDCRIAALTGTASLQDAKGLAVNQSNFAGRSKRAAKEQAAKIYKLTCVDLCDDKHGALNLGST